MARLPAGWCKSTLPASSQFISGLLLAGARYDKGLELLHTGRDPVPSQPHLDMTMDMLRGAGVDVRGRRRRPGTSLRVRYARGTLTVEPDLSNAAPFLAAAVVTGGAGAPFPAGPGDHPAG